MHPARPVSLFRLIVPVGAWCLLQLRPARAENSVSYKYADYRESGDRISVRSHYGMVEQDLGPDLNLKLQGVIDTIAGATPTGQPPRTPGAPVPLTTVHDRRKAWSLDVARQLPRLNLTVGYAHSRESDYVSQAASLNTVTDFNQKNTLLLLGVAGTRDEIRVFFQPEWVRKRTLDLIAGVTQLLDPHTSVTVNVSHGRSSGYHADPYRVVEQLTEVSPGAFLPLTYGENRPDRRGKWTLYAALNRAFPRVRGTAEASYRLFHDSFGTTAHTLELAWFQPFGGRLILRPAVRLYQQSAADFYRIDITGLPLTPTGRPVPEGPFYSADYRLSALRSHTVGLKAIWTVSAAWQIDVALERYVMRGRDDRTSASAYPRAAILTAGLRFHW